MEKHITLPLSAETNEDLKIGDFVYLSGEMYVARDAAHKRLMDLINEGKELPINLKDETIYYMGPTPARPGQVIGSAGPTTASRMDKYAPTLLTWGLREWLEREEDQTQCSMPLYVTRLFILQQSAALVQFFLRQSLILRSYAMMTSVQKQFAGLL